MKKFYACYGDFGNVYTLSYCENREDFAALPKGAERITRKEAIQLARREADRRRWEPSSAYYADADIMPAHNRYTWGLEDFPLRRNGRIWERN